MTRIFRQHLNLSLVRALRIEQHATATATTTATATAAPTATVACLGIAKSNVLFLTKSNHTSAPGKTAAAARLPDFECFWKVVGRAVTIMSSTGADEFLDVADHAQLSCQPSLGTSPPSH